MSTYVVDVDGTLCDSYPGCDYSQCNPIYDVIQAVNDAYDCGDYIILFTARGMRTYKGDTTQIKEYVIPVLKHWLNTHNVKYHELRCGKPWGPDVWYIDDKCLTPEQFVNKV